MTSPGPTPSRAIPAASRLTLVATSRKSCVAPSETRAATAGLSRSCRRSQPNRVSSAVSSPVRIGPAPLPFVTLAARREPTGSLRPVCVRARTRDVRSPQLAPTRPATIAHSGLSVSAACGRAPVEQRFVARGCPPSGHRFKSDHDAGHVGGAAATLGEERRDLLATASDRLTAFRRAGFTGDGLPRGQGDRRGRPRWVNVRVRFLRARERRPRGRAGGQPVSRDGPRCRCAPVRSLVARIDRPDPRGRGSAERVRRDRGQAMRDIVKGVPPRGVQESCVRDAYRQTAERCSFATTLNQLIWMPSAPSW